MLEYQILLIEVLLILGINIFIFIYSALSVDMSITLISLSIFLIILIPFYLILEKLEILLYIDNIEENPFFKLVFFYSTLINVFIGMYLTIESIYLIAFS
ncbi:MAG: hypothetical protein CEE43_08430 [Promethearchaeota archaeon Loki_b32]|nr:MAG: hypothetical protein CEE43_08430 [Candidatus Lokiarchaeota archaeon Loki_b32]